MRERHPFGSQWSQHSTPSQAIGLGMLKVTSHIHVSWAILEPTGGPETVRGAPWPHFILYFVDLMTIQV